MKGKPQDAFRRALAKRDDQIRQWWRKGTISKAAIGRQFSLSRERVRQIVNSK